MQLKNGGKFLKVTFLFLIFGAVSCAAVFVTYIVPLTCMYASLKSHKFDIIFEVLNLI